MFIVLQRHYTAFANVRLALLPSDLGELGELRLNAKGHLQHRNYRPTDNSKYTAIPVHLIDRNRTRRFACEVRLVTYYDYEYWFRFLSRVDSVIFYRLLKHRLERVMEGEYDSDEQDYWEEGGWTLNERGPLSDPPTECQCACHSSRYSRARPNRGN